LLNLKAQRDYFKALYVRIGSLHLNYHNLENLENPKFFKLPFRGHPNVLNPFLFSRLFFFF